MNNSLRIVLILLGLSLTGLAITGSVVYTRLTYVWVVLLVVSWLWSFISLQGVVVTRIPRLRRAQMGQIFEERYEVHNPGVIPRLWIEIKDQSPLPGSRGSHVITLISGKQRRSYLARSRLMQRGVFSLGPTVIASGDPFGLFPVEIEKQQEEVLLVYPMMFNVSEFPNPPGMLTGGDALRRRTHYITPNASGVREYAPGDSLNRIHWPTTVRRDRLMVKEFELDPLGDIWLFVDAERSINFAKEYSMANLSRSIFMRDREEPIQIPPSTEEYAASIAASLGRFYLKKRRAVGLVASGHTNTVLPPDRGGRQLGKILESLALLKCSGELPISGLIEAQAQHIVRGSTVVLITSTVRNQLLTSLDYINRRGLRPIVVLLDAESFGGPPGTDELAVSIKALNVPIRRIVNGDDLENSLVIPY